MSGLFIVLEGPEGAGKTTQRENIKQWFEDRGYIVHLTREPGGTPLAEEIRGLLLSPRDEKVCVTAELMLFFAARAQHVDTVIKPALERGEIVICDRFVDSTYAYQCYGRGIPYENIQVLERYALESFTPDITLWFDLPPELGMERVLTRGNKKDRFEAEEIDFFHRVCAGYKARAERAPERYLRVDATQSIDDVFEQIKPTLQALFIEHLIN